MRKTLNVDSVGCVRGNGQTILEIATQLLHQVQKLRYLRIASVVLRQKTLLLLLMHIQLGIM